MRIRFHVDMDGTLWDAEDRNRAIIQREAKKHAPTLAFMDETTYSAFWVEKWKTCAGKTETQIHIILGEHGHHLRTITPEAFEDHCRGQWPHHLEDVKINVELLHFLTEQVLQGHRAGIVTSSRAEDVDCYVRLAEEYVENANAIFGSVVSCDDVSVENRKPKPLPYQISAHHLGDGEDVLHIGIEDSMNGANSFTAAFGANQRAVLFYLNPHTPYQGTDPRVISVKDVNELRSQYGELMESLGQGHRARTPAATAGLHVK